jgi:hypothetical protein
MANSGYFRKSKDRSAGKARDSHEVLEWQLKQIPGYLQQIKEQALFAQLPPLCFFIKLRLNKILMWAKICQNPKTLADQPKNNQI